MGFRSKDFLEARTAAVCTLRQFDEDARRMQVSFFGLVAEHRRLLVENLVALGGEPWPYSPDGDNSWVVQ